MNIDFDRIEKIYGSSIINSIALLKDDKKLAKIY